MISQRVVCREFGEPRAVLALEQGELPDPGEGQILVCMEMAPVNPADLNLIEGRYGYRPDTPFVAGLEGGGIVEKCGPGVASSLTGMRVLPPMRAGAWQTALVADLADCVVLPERIVPEQAATLRVNPSTALRMLSDFGELQRGDWVAQNASNSAVGRHVIQIARHRGFRTLNFVRREEVMDELQKELGSSENGAVILDDDSAKDAGRAALDGAPLKLALNCVGGESASRLISLLANGGTIVTYGAMSRRPLTVSNAHLIFKDIVCRGFWVSRWLEHASSIARQAMFEELGRLAIDGVLSTPVDSVHKFADFASAVERAAEGARHGKVLIDMHAT